MAQNNFDPNMREDPETMSLYFKYIDDVKELSKYDSLNERMHRWKEICDQFENLCITSEQRKKFLTISELVLKSKFSGMSLQLFDTVSSEIKTKVKPFSLTKFSEKLKIRCKDENAVVDYSILASVALSAFRPAPHVLYLRGTDFFADVQIPAKKPRVKYAKDPVEEKTKPAAIVNKKSDVPENEIAVVFNALQSAHKKIKNTPVIYWKFIVDPTSFSKTVENIFYVSFLIRENLAKIFLRDDEILMIEPTNMNSKTKDKNHKLDQNHTIISIGHKEWKNLIRHFNIKEAMIKWKS